MAKRGRRRAERRRATIGRVLFCISASAIITALLLVNRVWPVDPWTIGGLFLLNFVAWALLHVQLKRDLGRRARFDAAERLLWMTAILGVGGAQLALRALGSASAPVTFLAMAPIAAQALVAATLLGGSTATISVTLTCLLIAVSGAMPPAVLAPAWICAAVGAQMLSPLRRRTDLFRGATILGGAMAIAAAAAAASQKMPPIQIGESAFWGVVAAIGASSIFWFGTLVMERLLGLTSDWSLLELCSPDHPLIQELTLRAPGTYAHSMAVASLAEQAARAVGANPVVCRAIATFHDIGKVRHPSAFIENQFSGHNIHDSLPPTVSAQIIVAHVQDGVDMGTRHKLPQVILDGIAEHHGNSLVGYFYQRALQESPDDLSESLDRLFRYPGPRPQTKESAIVHLADQVEAASRAFTQDRDFDQLVGTIVDSSRRDGQLDECPLTFRDLRAVRRAFTRALTAMRHDRIAYPGLDGPAHRDDPEPLGPADSERTRS
jgi:putative nucleotidyltransferase with HDIG domain